MTPLQYVTRQRITHAQQLIRETSRSLIDVGLEVGYSSPSHFAQIFRRVVGVTPTAFRTSLWYSAGSRQDSQDRESMTLESDAFCVE